MSSPSPQMPNPGKEGGRVFGLDGVRAVAALMVAAGHSFDPLYPHFPGLYWLGGIAGWGVELFFVLSGFLIGGILIRTGERLVDARELGYFYLRRWLRTIPIFFAFWALAVVIEYFWKNYHMGWGTALGHLFFVRNLWDVKITFMAESWSLAVEEWFYLLFPAALWLGLQAKGRFDRVFLTSATLFIALSTLARLVWAHFNPSGSWAYVPRSAVLYRFDALMFGVIAAWIAHHYADAWRRHRGVTALLGVILTLAMYMTLWTWDGHFSTTPLEDVFSKTLRFGLISLGFALLLPWASSWKLQRETIASRVVRALALWSYVIYLLHQPWYTFVHRWSFLPKTDTIAGAFVSFGSMFFGALLASAIVYLILEAPVMAFREKASAWCRERYLRH